MYSANNRRIMGSSWFDMDTRVMHEPRLFPFLRKKCIHALGAAGLQTDQSTLVSYSNTLPLKEKHGRWKYHIILCHAPGDTFFFLLLSPFLIQLGQQNWDHRTSPPQQKNVHSCVYTYIKPINNMITFLLFGSVYFVWEEKANHMRTRLTWLINAYE